MKSTGIVRKVDPLGRITIPMELRRTLFIEVKDALEVFVEEDKIILKSYKPLCYICGSDEDLRLFKDKNICVDCRKESNKISKEMKG